MEHKKYANALVTNKKPRDPDNRLGHSPDRNRLGLCVTKLDTKVAHICCNIVPESPMSVSFANLHSILLHDEPFSCQKVLENWKCSE